MKKNKSLFLGFLFKVSRKLKLNRIVYKSILKDKKTKNIKYTSHEKYQNAFNLLQQTNPDVATSCICQKQTIKPLYDVDIIVPVYNTKRYIKSCVDSILLQKTNYNFRIILVDDGSTDGSGELIDDLYLSNPKVHIIHQVNKGHSGARNRGLKELKSRYVMFVDSDDIVNEGAIDALLTAAFQNDADCVQGGYSIFKDNKIFRAYTFDNVKCFPKEYLTGFPWGKVYKAEVWNGICFPEGYWYEDNIIRFDLAFKIKTFFTISQIVYLYRNNSEGITATSHGKIKSIDTLWVFLSNYKDLQQMGYVWEQCDYEAFLKHITISVNRLFKLGIKINRAVFMVWRHFITENCLRFSSPTDKRLQMLEYSLIYDKFWLYLFACCG